MADARVVGADGSMPSGTYLWAMGLPGEGRTRAVGGYVCYLLRGAPDNAATHHAGHGETERLALLNALYWANQMPWVRVVPRNRAPRWVLRQLDGE